MALRSFVGKLRGLFPSRAANLGTVDELERFERRMVTGSALAVATGVGILAFGVPRLRHNIDEMAKLSVKNQALLRIVERLHELDDVEDEVAKAKEVSRCLQRLVDLGEGEKVRALLEEIKNMEDAEGEGEATGAH